MKLISNISLSMSLNKGKEEMLFESLDELIEFYNLQEDVLEGLVSFEKDKNLIGYVKYMDFDINDPIFIPIYNSELKSGDLKVVHNDVRYYNGFLIIITKESDFRSKMRKIDLGNIEGFLKFEDYG